MSFEEQYADVLQNIESAIVNVDRHDVTLLDYDVADALEALIRVYRAEEGGRTAPKLFLAEKPQRVFDAAKAMCEMRLGRGEVGSGGMPAEVAAISVGELVECLKRIEKSVKRWNKQGGRRGYMDFVSQYIM